MSTFLSRYAVVVKNGVEGRRRMRALRRGKGEKSGRSEEEAAERVREEEEREREAESFERIREWARKAMVGKREGEKEKGKKAGRWNRRIGGKVANDPY